MEHWASINDCRLLLMQQRGKHVAHIQHGSARKGLLSLFLLRSQSGHIARVLMMIISLSDFFFFKWLKCNITVFMEKNGIDDCSSSIENQKEENDIDHTSECKGNIAKKEAHI